MQKNLETYALNHLIFTVRPGIDSGVERVHLKIRGLVQGVFFRAHAREEAARLGLFGIVRNTPDGCVEVVAEGDRRGLEGLVAWCRRGPPSARVDSVDVSWEASRGSFKDFRITY